TSVGPLAGRLTTATGEVVTYEDSAKAIFDGSMRTYTEDGKTKAEASVEARTLKIILGGKELILRTERHAADLKASAPSTAFYIVSAEDAAQKPSLGGDFEVIEWDNTGFSAVTYYAMPLFED